ELSAEHVLFEYVGAGDEAEIGVALESDDETVSQLERAAAAPDAAVIVAQRDAESRRTRYGGEAAISAWQPGADAAFVGARTWRSERHRGDRQSNEKMRTCPDALQAGLPQRAV